MDRSRSRHVIRVFRLIACLLGLAAAGAPAPVGAQLYVSVEERFFTIQWLVERDGRDAAIVGFLSNDYLYALQRVQLRVEVVDGAGQTTTETFASVASDIPAGSRTSFRLPLPATGARYVVTVHAFEFGPRESP
jgi:hypothetical protein